MFKKILLSLFALTFLNQLNSMDQQTFNQDIDDWLVLEQNVNNWNLYQEVKVGFRRLSNVSAEIFMNLKKIIELKKNGNLFKFGEDKSYLFLKPIIKLAELNDFKQVYIILRNNTKFKKERKLSDQDLFNILISELQFNSSTNN